MTYRRPSSLPHSVLQREDGRLVHLYGDHGSSPAGYVTRDHAHSIADLRWSPQRREWVVVAAPGGHPASLGPYRGCPLCPSDNAHSSEIPATSFNLAVLESRLPIAMSAADPPPPRPASKLAHRVAGVCEILVYTDKHDGSFVSLNEEQRDDLLEVWCDRYLELGARPDVNYVFILENRGAAVGVTFEHPHGEVYGYPFIPPVAIAEMRAGLAYLRRANECLQCALVRAELEQRQRLLWVDGDIAAYVPSYARWPYEVHVAPIMHISALPDLPTDSRGRLGQALQKVVRAYDRLFNQPMPYMMVMHQRPTDGRPHPEAHLHVEFYPVMRSPGRLKFLAGGECGAGTFVSDGLPEEKAAELKRLL